MVVMSCRRRGLNERVRGGGKLTNRRTRRPTSRMAASGSWFGSGSRSQPPQPQTHGQPDTHIRILLVGDAGVGKTSLAHLLATGDPLAEPPSRTHGVSLSVRHGLHPRSHAPYTVQYVDVGGRCRHPASRRPFYAAVDGVLLVHDTSNPVTLSRLREWRCDVLDGLAYHAEQQETMGGSGGSGGRRSDPSRIPMMVVGTKTDVGLLSGSSRREVGWATGTSRLGGILGRLAAAVSRIWATNEYDAVDLDKDDDRPHRRGSLLFGRLAHVQDVADEFGLQSIRLSTQFITENTSAAIDAFIHQVMDAKTRPSFHADPYAQHHHQHYPQQHDREPAHAQAASIHGIDVGTPYHQPSFTSPTLSMRTSTSSRSHQPTH
ncbi:P-loop containing nucleoside triphosphate hydrolase protein [Entophlyctis helioformis]|nr:P-loop containing nucleoside triphosphate hydrolase protein [Entophlyctis helioformis]